MQCKVRAAFAYVTLWAICITSYAEDVLCPTAPAKEGELVFAPGGASTIPRADLVQVPSIPTGVWPPKPTRSATSAGFSSYSEIALRSQAGALSRSPSAEVLLARTSRLAGITLPPGIPTPLTGVGPLGGSVAPQINHPSWSSTPSATAPFSSGGAALPRVLPPGGALPKALPPRFDPGGYTLAPKDQEGGIGERVPRELSPAEEAVMVNLGYRAKDRPSDGCDTDTMADSLRLFKSLSASFPTAAALAEQVRQYRADSLTYMLSHPEGNLIATAARTLPLFLNNCVQPINQVAGASSLDFEHRLGVLTSTRGRGCLGYLLSRDAILLARHCWAMEQSEYSRGAVRFVLLGAPGREYQVCAMRTQGSPDGATIGREVVAMRIAPVAGVVLRTELASQQAAPLLDAGQLTVPSSLLTPIYLRFASVFDSRYTLDTGATKLAGCYVLNNNTQRGCFTHFCMTTNGSSGGPIFLQQGSSWRLFGVHVGPNAPVDQAYSTCVQDGVKLANAGVAVRASFLASFK